MKLVSVFVKALMCRTLTFSVTLIFGFAMVSFINSFNKEPETYILLTEIFNLKKAGCGVDARPNPLILLVKVDEHRRITLNLENSGSLADLKPLKEKLLNVFQEREYNGVYRDNSSEVEKQVIIQADKSIKYADVIQLIETLNKVGTNLIILDANNENCHPVGSA